MVQCAPTLVGSALRVVFGPQKSLLDNSRGAGGKNTAPTPHGHRFSLWFVTDATCRVTYVTFHISERTMATRQHGSGACGGVRRGSAVIMTVAILTPRCRRPALLTRRDAAWPLRRAVLTRCDAAWSPRRRSDAAATHRALAQWNVQTQVTSARHYITSVLRVFCYQLQVGTWALAWLRVGVIMTMHAWWTWSWSWPL